MVRDDVGFFRDGLYDYILSEEAPKFIAEFVGPVGTIAMVPNGTMGTHDYRTVDRGNNEDGPGEIPTDQNEHRREENNDIEPCHGMNPVFPILEEIPAGPEFFHDLCLGRLYKIPIFIFPTVFRYLKYLVHKSHIVILKNNPLSPNLRMSSKRLNEKLPGAYSSN